MNILEETRREVKETHFQSCHRHWLSDSRVHQNSQKGLLKTRLLDPTLELRGLG